MNRSRGAGRFSNGKSLVATRLSWTLSGLINFVTQSQISEIEGCPYNWRQFHPRESVRNAID